MNPTHSELAVLLKTALAASGLAAKTLRTEGTGAAVSSVGHDIKIKGDALAEKTIVAFLKLKSNIPILSEESGEISGSDLSGFKWIVDPLDGSLNFNRGIPLHCISISLWKRNQPILGVIEDFARNEVFSGIVGEGAWLNNEAIRVSETRQRSNAVLCTGFPVYTDFSREPLERFLVQVQEFKKVRLLGSAALSLAYVAAGRADCYMENNIMLWDVAAGIAIVMAAGGKAEWESRGKSFLVKASNGSV